MSTFELLVGGVLPYIAALVFVVGIFFALVGIMITLFATGFSITISGIALIVAGIIYPTISSLVYYFGISPLAVVFAGIALTSFGTLFLIGTWYIGKWLYIITIKYVKFNVKIIRGKSN